MAFAVSAVVGLGAAALGASALTAAGIGLAAGSLYNQNKTAKAQVAAQQQANTIAQQSATKAASQADQAMNMANKKSPDVGAALAGARQASMMGGSGTMLTGPLGVDQGQLSLGKNTLLGS